MATIRRTGGSRVGTGAALGTIGRGIRQAGQDLGTLFEKREERERRKPIEEMQQRLLTTQVEGAESKLKAEKEQREKTKTTRDDIAKFIMSGYGLDEESANKVAVIAENIPTSNNILLEAIDDPELQENMKTEEGRAKILKDLGSDLDPNTEKGKKVRAMLPPDVTEQIDNLMSQFSEPTEDLTATDRPLKPGERAPEAPKTSVYRPAETGELAKVEDEEPLEVRQAKALLQKFNEVGAYQLPAFETQIAATQKIIDDYEMDLEKKEERKFKISERELTEKSRAEQARLDREARAKESALQRDFLKEQKQLDREVAKLNKNNKKYSPDQRKAATFAIRIENDEEILKRLEDKGFNPADFKNRIVGKLDLSAIKDPDQRQYVQAVRDFINATLRRESGAAIAESEFTNALKQYFPRFRDDEETQEQMRNARLAIQAGLKAEAGEAVDEVRDVYNKLLENAKNQSKKDGQNNFGLEVGKIEDGYRYNGGDPANPESWEKL